MEFQLSRYGSVLRKCVLKFHINISAHITIIAAWELEGQDEAKIVKKMRRIRLKRVTVRLKKITIFPVGEHLIAGYEVDVIGATAFREEEFGLELISRVLSCTRRKTSSSLITRGNSKVLVWWSPRD